MLGDTYTSIRRAKKKKKKATLPNTGEDAEKLGHRYIAGRNVKCCRHFGKPLDGFT